jgi:ankyrin repeat protein
MTPGELADMQRALEAQRNRRFERGETLLHLACEGGDVDRATDLLDVGRFDPNARDDQDRTPLHYACQSGEVECARLLLETTVADVHARDIDGETPLHAAFLWVECVRLLLKHEASVDAQDDDERTPLHLACACGSVEYAAVLLEAGANVRAVDWLGLTPLHKACSYAHVGTARLLLEAGADVDAVDDLESTPLHYACERGSSKCTRLLLEAGANGRASTASGKTPSGLANVVGSVHHRACRRLVRRANFIRAERGVPVGAPLFLDWTESTHHLLVKADKRLLTRALGALLLVDARREGGATLGREGALAFVAGLARVAGV